MKTRLSVLALLMAVTLGLTACGGGLEPSESGGNSMLESGSSIPQTPQQEFERPKTTLVGDEGSNNWIYRLGEDGLTVREVVIDAGLGGDPVEIVQITDAHIGWNAARETWKTCLRYASQYDYTVATGDLIEATHPDLMTFFKESIADYPNLMACFGNHEWSGKIEGMPEKRNDRYPILQEVWPNDVYYSSVVVQDRVMLIQMDNSQNTFHDSQVPLLTADIKKARENGYAVLVFYHVPMRTENPAEAKLAPILAKDPDKIVAYNFYDAQIRGGREQPTGKIYNLLTGNADVVRGIFCGHFHEDFYTEMMATTPDGTKTVLPQIISFQSNADDGHVTKITVK